MFFSFVSFMTNRGLFLTGLENIVYDDVYDCNDDVGIFFQNSNFGGRGRGKPRPNIPPRDC